MKKSLPIINTGLRLDIPEHDDLWIAGKGGKNLSGIDYEVVNESGDWSKYAQKDETQKPFNVDWMDCTCEGLMECIGMQVNFFIENGIIDPDQIKDWLDEDGKFNGSERELAEVSGNTPNGNSMQNVLEAVRKKGVAPDSYNPRPTTSISWNLYHSNSTAKSKSKALDFLNYFNFKYERLPVQFFWGQTVKHNVIKQHLKQAPLYAAAGTCPGWFNKDIIPVCSMQANHAFCIQGQTSSYNKIKDSYPPYNRKLPLNYITPYVYKPLLIPKDNILLMKSNVKIVKQKDSNTYGFFVPANSPNAFMSQAANFGLKVAGQFPDNPDWEAIDKNIDGVVEINK
jgi:hypothetical protein